MNTHANKTGVCIKRPSISLKNYEPGTTVIRRRSEYTKNASPVETDEYKFYCQGCWFKTEEEQRQYLTFRNRRAKARRAGVDPTNEKEYRAYIQWLERGENRTFLDEPQMKLDEINELIDQRGLPNMEFIIRVIEIVERGTK